MNVTLKSLSSQKMHVVDCGVCILAWDGYQCGYCGMEFKTKAELTQHQMSSHPSRGPQCPGPRRPSVMLPGT